MELNNSNDSSKYFNQLEQINKEIHEKSVIDRIKLLNFFIKLALIKFIYFFVVLSNIYLFKPKCTWLWIV